MDSHDKSWQNLLDCLQEATEFQEKEYDLNSQQRGDDKVENKRTKRKIYLWTEEEKICLVGNVYDQMFLKPILSQDAWKIIYEKFLFDCEMCQVDGAMKRSLTAVQRYFKYLKKYNAITKGEMFIDLHRKWKHTVKME
eukprot:snap_masked-scaffold_11-processed-gene-3.20-mRNA-1 protein AED:1.00 eAED:1.00 QI:0/0/0/0/1/1/2/0/137